MIKIAIEVDRAELLEIITPRPGFNIDNVLALTVEADPNSISVMINKTFFLFKDLYFIL